MRWPKEEEVAAAGFYAMMLWLAFVLLRHSWSLTADKSEAWAFSWGGLAFIWFGVRGICRIAKKLRTGPHAPEPPTKE